MEVSKTVLACMLGLALQGTASAQIYESKDAEGVTEFSDTPTQGAEVVDLPSTNVVTPVEEPEVAPATARESVPDQREGGEQVVGEAVGEAQEPGYIYYGGDDNEEGAREQRREDAARIDNRLPHEISGEARNESAGDAAVMHPDNAEGVMRPEAHGAGGAGRR